MSRQSAGHTRPCLVVVSWAGSERGPGEVCLLHHTKPFRDMPVRGRGRIQVASVQSGEGSFEGGVLVWARASSVQAITCPESGRHGLWCPAVQSTQYPESGRRSLQCPMVQAIMCPESGGWLQAEGVHLELRAQHCFLEGRSLWNL